MCMYHMEKEDTYGKFSNRRGQFLSFFLSFSLLKIIYCYRLQDCDALECLPKSTCVIIVGFMFWYILMDIMSLFLFINY